MRIHEIKCWPEMFEPLIDGRKSFEVRRFDRTYGVGDVLCIREWDPAIEDYTERAAYVGVTYVLKGGQFGISDAFCVMSIKLMVTCFIKER